RSEESIVSRPSRSYFNALSRRTVSFVSSSLLIRRGLLCSQSLCGFIPHEELRRIKTNDECANGEPCTRFLRIKVMLEDNWSNYGNKTSSFPRVCIRPNCRTDTSRLHHHRQSPSLHFAAIDSGTAAILARTRPDIFAFYRAGVQ